MTTLSENEIYDAIGENGIRRFVAEFYRQIPGDDILGPMYPAEDLTGAEERLRGFLIFRFGGPQTYIEERGHPRLRMRHAPFTVNQDARDRWIQLMDHAITAAEIPEPAAMTLRQFFDQVATFLINR